MRIGLFSDTFPPDINGVANSTNILREELIRHGHEVFVVSPKEGAGLAEWNEDHTHLGLAGIKVQALYGYVITTPIHLHALSEIRRLHLDLIHVQTEFGVGIFARSCAKQLEIPLVSTYHTDYEDYTHYVNPLHSETLDVYAKKALSVFSRYNGDTSAAVIVPSEKTKELLEKYHVHSRIFVVPTGLQLNKFDPAGEVPEKTQEIRKLAGAENSRLIVYVGRIAQEKSLDLVIDGFREAVSLGTQCRLLIVGGGPDLERLKNRAVELHLSNVITFSGPVSPDEVPHYYRAADAFVSASLSETQGMTFIEALAGGLPLFARKDEVLNGLLVPETTGWFFSGPEDFAEKIIMFEKLDGQRLQQMKESCLEKVVPYSSETFYQRAMHVYEEAIDIYQSMRTVNDVRVNRDSVLVSLSDGSGEETRITMSLDDYDRFGLKKGMRVPDHLVEQLKDREDIAKAYQSCLRRISVKDRTVQEIRDWLEEHTALSEEGTEEILNKLLDHGYVDDRRYCESSISSMKLALFGEERIIRDLKKKGLPEDMIRECLNAIPHDEVHDAVEYAVRIKDSIKEESVRLKKKKLQTKLMQKGYASETARKAVDELDYAQDELNEPENLARCITKARRRYERKYKGKELKYAVFRYCLTQGYPAEKVYRLMDEMEWTDDED